MRRSLHRKWCFLPGLHVSMNSLNPDALFLSATHRTLDKMTIFIKEFVITQRYCSWHSWHCFFKCYKALHPESGLPDIVPGAFFFL